MAPKVYQKLRAKQKQAIIEAGKQAKAIVDSRKDEEKQLYNDVCLALKEYHNEKIDQHVVVIKKLPSTNQVYLFVDGNHYLTFFPKRFFYTCNGTNTWITLSVIQHHKKKEDREIYFPCNANELDDADVFAEAIAKMMDSYWLYDY